MEIKIGLSDAKCSDNQKLIKLILENIFYLFTRSTNKPHHNVRTLEERRLYNPSDKKCAIFSKTVTVHSCHFLPLCNPISMRFWILLAALLGQARRAAGPKKNWNCTLQKMAIKTTSLKGLMVEVDLCFGRILAEWWALHRAALGSLIVWVLCFALKRLLRNEILLYELYARIFLNCTINM